MLIIFPSNLVTLRKPDISSIKIPIPTSPLPIPERSIDDIFFNAPDNIDTAILMLIIVAHDFVTPVILVDILLNTDNDPINSPNRTVMAVNERPKDSESMEDITSIEPANMPIAPAIVRSVPAFN